MENIYIDKEEYPTKLLHDKIRSQMLMYAYAYAIYKWYERHHNKI